MMNTNAFTSIQINLEQKMCKDKKQQAFNNVSKR